MIIDEFKRLRDLPNKVISDDLTFAQTASPFIFRFEEKVFNALGYDVILTATYNDSLPSVVFNFRVVGNGAVCRYCVNGAVHKDEITRIPTRTHKHTPKQDRCFNNNLPVAHNRTDLSISDFSDVELIWETVCAEANIEHSGRVIKQ